jgi:hypothetical protein
MRIGGSQKVPPQTQRIGKYRDNIAVVNHYGRQAEGYPGKDTNGGRLMGMTFSR